MKYLLPLFALSLSFTACSSHRDVWASPQPMATSNVNATRRDMYSPAQPSGKYTEELRNGSWKENGKPVDEQMREQNAQRTIQKTPVKTAPPAPTPTPDTPPVAS